MKRNRLFALSVLSAVLLLNNHPATADEPIKIGFVVKQPEEPWFQDEWKFAEI